MKILIVEDQDDSRQTLRKLIELRGHEVAAVATAEEAERALGETNFPFLILDWMLPGKSGIDLCRELRLRADGDEMFILLVTAKGDREDLEQALEAGANDYLTKPIDLSRLNVRLSVAERQIRSLIERNQARRELQESARTMTNILENTADGFVALDASGRFTYLTPGAESLLWRSRHEVIGQQLRLRQQSARRKDQRRDDLHPSREHDYADHPRADQNHRRRRLARRESTLSRDRRRGGKSRSPLRRSHLAPLPSHVLSEGHG